MPTVEELTHLRAPFEAVDLEWSPVFTLPPKNGQGEPAIYVSPYVKRLAVINRLNQVCGITGWATDARARDGHLAVGVGILVERPSGSEWVWRWDGTGYLEAEPPHFTLSDAGKGDFTNGFKRVTIQWGIGLDLKELKPQRAIINGNGRYKSKIGNQQYRWDPPGITGTPSRPGEILSLHGTRAEEDPHQPPHRDPVPTPKGPTAEEAEQLRQQAKNVVRAFMRKNHLQAYHLDAVIQRHPTLKHRAPNGGRQLGEIGTHEDWQLVVDLTVNAKRTRWDEAPKELAKEFPTTDERVQELRDLMTHKRPTGEEAVIIESAIASGWNDAVEHWMEELRSR